VAWINSSEKGIDVSNYLMACLSIGLTAVAQILLKLGVVAAASASTAPLPTRLFRMIMTPQVLAGLTVYALSTVCWLFALSKLKLSVAYPMVSLSYVLVTIGAAVMLGEVISRNQIIGLSLIIAGVVFLVR
jgi:drug/metabolite transporter (DMT)-like permease